jgi:hypothetical protein
MSPDITITEKYRQLYDAACVTDGQPSLGPDSAYVSIHYTAPWGVDTDVDYIGYKRLADKTSNCSRGKRRPDKDAEPDEKKKRVRAGKNKDLGALLGDFT